MADEKLVLKIVVESDLKTGIQEVEQLGTAAKADVKIFNDLKKGILDGVNEPLKQATDSQKKLTDEVKKFGKEGDTATKNLKTQIKEAKQEALKLADAFGENSAQARNAQKAVAGLVDKQGDLNDRIKAFNPDAKFQALTQVLGGAFGGFQALTGALQVFGSKNEEVNAIVDKFQGLINVAGGLSQLGQLKDAFGNLKSVLGITTVAQEALTVATVESTVADEASIVALEGVAVAEGEAAVGAEAFQLSLGPIVAVLAAVAVAAYALYDALHDGSLKELRAEYEALTAAGSNQLDILTAQGAKETEVTALRIKNINDQINFIQKLKDFEGANSDEGKKIILEEIELKKKLNIQSIILLRQQAEAQKKVDKDYIDSLIKKQDAIEASYAQQAALKKFYFDTIYKDAQDNADEVTILNIKANRSDLDNQIQATKDKLVIAEKAGDDTHALRIKLATQEVALVNETEKKKQDARDKTRALLNQGLNIANQLIDQSFQFEKQQIQNRTDEAIAAEKILLDKKLITQKQYDANVRQIKNKQAQDEKRASIAQARLDIALAILKAIASDPYPKNLPSIAFAVIAGAIQLSAIQSQPIPKFFKGSKFVNGGAGGVDDIPAFVNRGEAIIPTATNKAYFPTISAIYDGKIKPSTINAFVERERKGIPHAAVTRMDNYDLIRAVKGNSQVSIRNENSLAKAIARELVLHTNLRMQ